MIVPGGVNEIKRRTALLLVEYAKATDSRQREIEGEIVELNDPLITKRMESFGVTPVDWQDIKQEARLAAVLSIRKFDPGPDVENPRKFSTWVVKAIDGFICNWFRDRGWAMAV